MCPSGPVLDDVLVLGVLGGSRKVLIDVLVETEVEVPVNRVLLKFHDASGCTPKSQLFQRTTLYPPEKVKTALAPLPLTLPDEVFVPVWTLALVSAPLKKL